MAHGHAKERRVREGEATKNGRDGGNEVNRRVVTLGQSGYPSPQQLEGAHTEGDQELLLGAEEAVDSAGGGADAGGNSAHGEGVDAALVDDLLGGIQQGVGGTRIVLPPPPHA